MIHCVLWLSAYARGGLGIGPEHPARRRRVREAAGPPAAQRLRGVPGRAGGRRRHLRQRRQQRAAARGRPAAAHNDGPGVRIESQWWPGARQRNTRAKLLNAGVVRSASAGWKLVVGCVVADVMAAGCWRTCWYVCVRHAGEDANRHCRKTVSVLCGPVWRRGNASPCRR